MNMRKILSLCMALMLMLTCVVPAFAADVADATINSDAPASLTLYKYDWTNAHKDGVWNEDSFISTGWKESYVETVLGGAVRQGDADGEKGNVLGNGQNSNGYALKGVEFTAIKVADIVTFTESANDAHPDYNLTQVLYGFHKQNSNDYLKVIGLGDGEGRYENAGNSNKLSDEYWYYTSDALNKALSDALNENSSVVKSFFESYLTEDENGVSEDIDGDGRNDIVVMPFTDENGKTSASNLEVGLWLVVETKVPEMVTCTTNPFFVSLPMTTVSGNQHSASPEGGHQWNYDVVLYPKNETGLITLEKTVRENLTGVIADTLPEEDHPMPKMAGDWESNPDLNGFAHTGTGSAGDIMDYQIISTLPTITSVSTSLTTLHFYDSLQKGLKYNQDAHDVKIEIFTDAACTDKVASWNMNSGKFTVEYSESNDDYHMSINITPSGLAEINNPETLLDGSLYAGYSNHTIRITYSATIVSDNNVIFGENGNENDVVLTWKRTSQDYYDTLKDDCHVYTFGIDLIKVFSNMDSQTATQNGMFEHVKFKVRNETDGYWVVAALNAEEGIYYATGVTTEESEATVFTPVTYAADTENPYGHIMVKGLEDDEYVLTEIETVNGYTLLKDDIHVVITAEVDETRACDVYTENTLGLLQNDPHYAFGCNKGTEDLTLANIPQKHLAHNHLTAHATVDGNDVTMLEDRGSLNAEAPLTVKNTPGLNPPPTGDDSAKMMGTVGVIMAFASVFMIAMLVIPSRKKNKREA